MGRETTTRSNSRSDDDLEKLITKVCTNFDTQLREELNPRMDKLDTKFNKICESLSKIQNSVQNNTKSIVELQNRIDIMEQHSKRNALRICGFSEREDEALLNLIPEFITQKLNINCATSDIDYVFRLKKSDDKSDIPAPILVNFLSNVKRNSVFNAKKLLKNSPVSIFEDLTRLRFETLLAAKKKHGKNMAWSSSGKLYVWISSENKKIEIKPKSDQ